MAVVRAYLAAQNAHDIDAILATLADTLEIRAWPAGQGDIVLRLHRAAQREMYARADSTAPNSRFMVRDSMVVGSTVIMREEAHHLSGVQRQVGLRLYRVKGDRLVAIWFLPADNPTGGF